MTGIVTELIGGPLDGIEIDLDDDISVESSTLHSVHIAMWQEGDSPIVKPILLRYMVAIWRHHRLALIFDGYDE